MSDFQRQNKSSSNKDSKLINHNQYNEWGAGGGFSYSLKNDCGCGIDYNGSSCDGSTIRGEQKRA